MDEFIQLKTYSDNSTSRSRGFFTLTSNIDNSLSSEHASNAQLP